MSRGAHSLPRHTTHHGEAPPELGPASTWPKPPWLLDAQRYLGVCTEVMVVMDRSGGDCKGGLVVGRRADERLEGKSYPLQSVV